MKRFLFIATLFAVLAVAGVKAQNPWQYSYSTKDAIKEKGVYNSLVTPVIELDEPTDVLRLTVFATKNTDNNAGTRAEGYANASSSFPTFAIGELRVYDGNGNLVELTEENLETNALSLDEGALAFLVDGDINTFFHSTYSRGEVPQAYHYIEIALPDALDKFRVEFDSRHYWFFTDPTFVAITGGTEALPWVEENFSLGDQVTEVAALKPNTFYAIRGNYFEYTRIEDGRYLPSYGEAFYHSPHGAAITPSAASVMFLEDAGDGKYYMRWLKNDHYVSDPGMVTEGAYAGWNDDVRYAAPMEFFACDSIAGAFEIMSGETLLGQRRFVKMSWVNATNMAAESATYNYAWNIYNVNIDNSAVVPVLQSSIELAESLLKEQGAPAEEGDVAAFVPTLNEAKKAVAEKSLSAQAMFTLNAELNNLTTLFRTEYLFTLLDSVNAILENDDIEFCDAETGWIDGGYPTEYKDRFQNLLDNGSMLADNARHYVKINEIVTEISSVIGEFWGARVSNVSSYPLLFKTENGMLTDQRDNIYYWTSPVYYMDQPTDVIRMTVFTNSSGETEPDQGGTPFFALGEFILYDATGNQIVLTEDMFSTNSVQTNDGWGLAGLCDGNPGTFYHGCYAVDPGNGSYAPENAADGECCYIEVALDEEITAFSYGFVSRQYPGDYYKHIPTFFAFTPGTAITKEEADALSEAPVDEFEGVLGEQITKVEQIVPGELYALYGNLSVLDANGEVVGEGTGFYSDYKALGKDIHSSCAVVFEAAEDGKFYIRSLNSDIYMKKPTHWSGISTTYYKSESFPMTIVESTNLEDAFKLYWRGEVTDSMAAYFGEGEVYFMMQDWGSYIGMYTIPDLADDDKDGESDWYIYKMSVKNRGKMELDAVVDAVKAVGVDTKYVGESVGMYSGAGINELIEAISKAEALSDSGDDAACAATAAELQNLLQTAVPNLSMVEIVSGQEYIIRSANEEFVPYHGDTKFSMYVGPTNYQDTQRLEETMLWWSYEYLNGIDSTAYHFTFTEDTTKVEGAESSWRVYTVKNVFADKYIIPEIGHGKNLVVGEFEPENAPRIFVTPSETPGMRRLVGVEAWKSVDNIYSYFEVRTGGGGYGTGGEAHYGHVAQWYFLANTAQWKIIPVSRTTSIDDLIIEEPAGEIVSQSYYTVDGIASSAPVKGKVNIVKIVYANGVIETKKMFVK